MKLIKYKDLEQKNYAIVYYDSRGVYQVQLFDASDISLERLKEKADQFNKNKYSRTALVVTEPVIIAAFQYFHQFQLDLSRRIKGLERSLFNLADEVQSASFVKVAMPKEA